MSDLMVHQQANYEPRLRESIHAGLVGCSGREDEIVTWIMTGLPVDIDFSGPAFRAPTLGKGAALELIASAFGEGDAATEWRLGSMITRREHRLTGPMAALSGARYLRGYEGPDEQRTGELLAAAGVSEEEYLESLLSLLVHEGWDLQQELRERTSFSWLVVDNPEVVRRLLTIDANEVGNVTTCLLDASEDALRGYSDLIAWLLTNTSKKRRSAGVRLGAAVGYESMAEALQHLATNGNDAVQAAAIRSLGRLAGDGRRDEVMVFCSSSFTAECSSVVQSAIADVGLEQTSSTSVLDVQLPNPIKSVKPDDAARLTYEALVEQLHIVEKARHDRAQEIVLLGPVDRRYQWAIKVERTKRCSPDLEEQGWRYLCDGGPVPSIRFSDYGPLASGELIGALQPLHTFRLLNLTHSNLERGGLWIEALLENYRQTGSPKPLDLQAAAEAAGFSRKTVLDALPKKLPWSRDDTWPWVAALLPDFLDVISSGPVDPWDSIEKYYAAISCLPTLPAGLRRVLLEHAVSGHKTEAPLARSALESDENLVASVADYLTSKKFGQRAEAASWLVDLGATEAVVWLHQAAAKEKHDHAKGSILTALERLGEAIYQYLDSDLLLAESVKAQAKKGPSVAEWISFDLLPSIRWRDGTSVDEAIMRRFINQAVRLKSPAPSPIVRRFFARMDQRDVEAFSDAILSMWLAEDLQTISVEEASRRARQEIGFVRASHQSYSDLVGMSDADLMAYFMQRFGREPRASATASKGLLSIVAAGGGLAVVAPAEAYLRRWYGLRLSQCKALIEMLAWIEDPNAVQLVLSVGSRFRTKGIQKEAVRQAELLAGRNGWTMQDLADRTVPTAGFGPVGWQVFDYGERRFTARLADDLVIVVSTDEGKELKGLPAPRKNEDRELVKRAKKDFTSVKKQVRVAAKEQPLRLHEAMCLQRRYDVSDFRRYVLGHPISSRLATRLVWASLDPAGERTLFRPLSDGTPIDEHDEEFSWASTSAVVLAHGELDGGAAGYTWKRHFADYQIAALFEQFGRPKLPVLLQGQERLAGCTGAIFDDRRIRAESNKYGYQLGPGEEGGAVSVIKRRFPAAGIEARVAVRGLHAMILEQEVALEYLHFGPLDEVEIMALADVPPILLVETIAAVEQIVAASEGIDKNWENRIPC